MICYSCQKDLPAGVAVCPNCGQAVYCFGDGKTPSVGRVLNGCLMGAPSPKDYVATPRETDLPRRVDLRPDCPPVEDQGQLSSCTSNAACGALEYQRRKSGQGRNGMSRLFVYFNARRLRNEERDDSGAEIPEVMAALLAYGTPEETLWPYRADHFAAAPSADIYTAALKNQPTEYARVRRGDGVRGSLAQGFPVVFAISLPQRCYQAAGGSGKIPMATPEESEAAARDGAHCMLIVGYDQDDQTYIVRNSWGIGWGQAGYATIPMQLIDATARREDFWILGHLDQGRGFDVMRPGKLDVAGTVSGKSDKMREAIRGRLDTSMTDAAQRIRDRFKNRPQ